MPWTKIDDKILLTMIQEGYTHTQIESTLDKTSDQILQRLRLLARDMFLSNQSMESVSYKT